MQSCPNSPGIETCNFEGIPAVRKAPIEADVNLGEATRLGTASQTEIPLQLLHKITMLIPFLTVEGIYPFLLTFSSSSIEASAGRGLLHFTPLLIKST